MEQFRAHRGDQDQRRNCRRGRPDDARPTVKPRLRGWLHAGTAPLALAAGIVLVCLAPTAAGVIGGAVFLAASVLLFGTSGIYHRCTWGPRGEAILRRTRPREHLRVHRRVATPRWR